MIWETKTNLPGQSKIFWKHFFLQHDLQSSKLHFKPYNIKMIRTAYICSPSPDVHVGSCEIHVKNSTKTEYHTFGFPQVLQISNFHVLGSNFLFGFLFNFLSLFLDNPGFPFSCSLVISRSLLFDAAELSDLLPLPSFILKYVKNSAIIKNMYALW